MKTAGVILAVCGFAYMVLACARYRFQHREMTETQLFLHIPSALLLQ
jgi:hypothetical protein